ncbi:MAG: HRDC domain-containing protein, partial [Paramuribaculum sp.]|nr:HRDC domain-containing protein [Paramuribaculum sp.]
PTTPAQLLQVPGIGKAKLDLYGPQLLQIIKDYSPK